MTLRHFKCPKCGFLSSGEASHRMHVDCLAWMEVVHEEEETTEWIDSMVDIDLIMEEAHSWRMDVSDVERAIDIYGIVQKEIAKA